jgi:hypothetical protein
MLCHDYTGLAYSADIMTSCMQECRYCVVTADSYPSMLADSRNAGMQMPLLSTACCAVTTDSYPSMLADSMNARMQMPLVSSACGDVKT